MKTFKEILPFKIYVDGKSKEIQEKLFQFGITWCSVSLNTAKVLHTEYPFLFINENKNLTYASSMTVFLNNKYKELKAEDFLSMDFNNSDLDAYTPKGELKGVPKTIIKKLLQNQVQQGNPEDITVFENSIQSVYKRGGFDWNKTKEGEDFWRNVINYKNFNVFFSKYYDRYYCLDIIKSKGIKTMMDIIYYMSKNTKVEILISSKEYIKVIQDETIETAKYCSSLYIEEQPDKLIKLIIKYLQYD